MPSETLVMIPPMMCDARIFKDQIATLSRSHAVLVAPSSCGERMEEMASQILSWAPSRFALMGAGLGGMIAMEIMRRAQDRVTRLALISTTAQADTPQAAAAREDQIIAARSGRWDDVLRHEINSTWMAPTTDRAGLVRRLTEMGQDVGPAAYVKQARALQRRKDQQSALAQIMQPTCVICGQHDGQYNVKRHSFLAEIIPFAKLEVIETAGYLPTAEAPEEVTACLQRWMKQPMMLR